MSVGGTLGHEALILLQHLADMYVGILVLGEKVISYQKSKVSSKTLLNGQSEIPLILKDIASTKISDKN